MWCQKAYELCLKQGWVRDKEDFLTQWYEMQARLRNTIENSI